MNSKLKTLCAGLAVAGVVACAPPETMDTAADMEAINAARGAEAAGITAGDVEASLAAFTADVRFMPPNEPMLNGHQAVRGWFEGAIEQFSINLSYAPTDITVAGDWAFERYTGTAVFTPKAGGEGMTEEIKGIHIYQRQADGSWKIAQDIWNSNMPVAPM